MRVRGSDSPGYSYRAEPLGLTSAAKPVPALKREEEKTKKVQDQPSDIDYTYTHDRIFRAGFQIRYIRRPAWTSRCRAHNFEWNTLNGKSCIRDGSFVANWSLYHTSYTTQDRHSDKGGAWSCISILIWLKAGRKLDMHICRPTRNRFFFSFLHAGASYACAV